MGAMRWLYGSHDTLDVLRTRHFGSRRTVLHLIVVSSLQGGPTVWMLAALGWCLTVGPEDGVHEAMVSGREFGPFRYRIWRRADGRAAMLSYTPGNADVTQQGGG